jgi:GDP-L-fucose synthase
VDKSLKIFIAGHKGMVGSACWRILKKSGYSNLIGKSSKELDLKNQSLVKEFFENEKPNIVINAAAKVGGILANNDYPYEFLIENMLIQNNLIHYSFINDVKKFIFLGSSCIYPKFCNQPIKENYLLSGNLEPTNQWYALAKISGVKLIEALKTQYNKNYVSLMPTNLYGPNDNFDLKTSHVLPALIRKFHDAKINNVKKVILWGSGKPLREFLHVDDLAKAVKMFVENNFKDNLYNVGSGKDISIEELAYKIKLLTNYKGNIIWDTSKPDGTPKKLMDSSIVNKMGFKPEIDLDLGLKMTYNWYINNITNN